MTALAQKPEASILLNALPDPVLVVDGDSRLSYLNLAAEQFFAGSSASLCGKKLSEILSEDSPLVSLVAQLRQDGLTKAVAHGVLLEGQKFGQRLVGIDLASVQEDPGSVVISLREEAMARKIDRQLTHRGAARSVTAMAAMLAHEVKNPLSGIRGAAQLLESGLDAEGRSLTRLICDEADRIVDLVDRMELFADERPLQRRAINIHEVLSHVRKLAANGFARQVRFHERYDPSLPSVLGNRDLLVQALLNLVKNAAEATSGPDAEIRLTTRFQQGVRLVAPGTTSRVDLPLVISVEDNGAGIPEDLRAHLFDPFVSGKPSGKGLGLALVAKIVEGHGGIIEFDSQPGRTVFRLFLPAAR